MRNLIIFFIIISTISCRNNEFFGKVFKASTAYEKYKKSLVSAGLDKSGMGKDWINAGKEVFKDSNVIALPFKETGYFPADNPSANSYLFKALAGEVISIHLQITSGKETRIFTDLFSFTKGKKHLESMDSARNFLEYEVEDNQVFILRLQPELLRSGQYTLIISTNPALAFPVQNKNSKAIKSFFGAARDGGKRKHEGIDIFAKKHTPALAVSKGRIARVNNNRLGGKVVWLSDAERNQRYYYAHLDSQLVKPGQRVIRGDTIGLIGNTGNAANTPPHLHFGIYRLGKGAVDPYPYVYQPSKQVKSIKVDTRELTDWRRTAVEIANLRLSPSTNSPILGQLPKYTPLLITAGTDRWYRVVLPNGVKGYIYGPLTEPVDRPVTTQKLHQEIPLRESAKNLGVIIGTMDAGSTVDIMAAFDELLLVRQNDLEGWAFNTSIN